MSRDYEAYLTPSGLIVGMAIHDLFSGFVILASKRESSSKTLLWKVSLLTGISVLLFIVCQILVIDYYVSPYMVPNYYLGLIIFLNYVFNMVVTICISFVIVVRIKIFFGGKSRITYFMYAMAAITIVMKFLGNGIGAKVAYDAMTLRIPNPTQNSLYTVSVYLTRLLLL
jgi:membrane-associated HD superfamily phosphohydrolase